MTEQLGLFGGRGARSHRRGREIVTIDGTWAYVDTGTPVAADPYGTCGRCGKEPIRDGHEDYDACLGVLDGVMNACCGHGVEGAAYVQFSDGTVVDGLDALAAQRSIMEASVHYGRVMVDELKQWGRARHRCFAAGSCHLTADCGVEELHVFAQRLGMRRSWYQDHPRHPHYDLTPSRRARALRLGAVFVSAREQARARMKLTKQGRR